MSLAKAALFAARPQGGYLARIQRRGMSSDPHSHDEHHGAENVSYPKEGMIRTHAFILLSYICVDT